MSEQMFGAILVAFFVGLVIGTRIGDAGGVSWEMARQFASSATHLSRLWRSVPWDAIHELIELADANPMQESYGSVEKAREWVRAYEQEAYGWYGTGEPMIVPEGMDL